MATVTSFSAVWGQMPNGVPQRMGGGGRDREAISSSSKLKESREMGSWLEENIGRAGDLETGVTTAH